MKTNVICEIDDGVFFSQLVYDAEGKEVAFKQRDVELPRMRKESVVLTLEELRTMLDSLRQRGVDI